MENLKWEILAYITENRLNACISKIGSFTTKSVTMLQELLSLMVSDILEDFETNQGTEWSELTSPEKTEIEELLTLEVKTFMKQILRNRKTSK